MLASEPPDPSQSWETCYKHEQLHPAISVCLVSVLGFGDRVSLFNSPGCPGAHSVEQAGLRPSDPPASASQVLGSKAGTTMAWQHPTFDMGAEFMILMLVHQVLY